MVTQKAQLGAHAFHLIEQIELGFEPGQLTRSSRALPRAGQHTSKLDVSEALSKFPRSVLAARGQRNVCATGVLAGE
jgi:hypothetical protein